MLIILVGALLTALYKVDGQLALWEGQQGRQIVLRGFGTELERFDLPFAVRLDSFEMDFYQGTRRPAMFRSRVTVLDGATELPGVTEMNRPLHHGGFSFFQSSYQIDGGREMSVLSVARDPGQAVAFLGYTCLVLGMIVVFATRLIQARQAGRQPASLGGLKIVASALVALLTGVTAAAAAEHSRRRHRRARAQPAGAARPPAGLYLRMNAYFQGRDIFVQDTNASANPHYRLPIRVITENAWHSLFARNLFLRVAPDDLTTHVPQFTILQAPGFRAIPEIDGTNSDVFIVLNFSKRMVLIGGTSYAGEIKKSVFTILNYLLPSQGVLSMHCSANIGRKGDVALFFGLSGTGKTTLSSDVDRGMIGDDEHGWGGRVQVRADL